MDSIMHTAVGFQLIHLYAHPYGNANHYTFVIN